MLERKATYLGIFDKMFHWHIDLVNGAESYQCTYRAGLAHCAHGDQRFPNKPTLEEIMYCMASDWGCPENFEEYCDEFGWPENKAEYLAAQKICTALREQNAAMRRLFGTEVETVLEKYREG